MDGADCMTLLILATIILGIDADKGLRCVQLKMADAVAVSCVVANVLLTGPADLQ